MSLRRSIAILGVISAFVLLPLCRAADDPNADTLKSKDLVKTGTTYVLSVEQEVAEQMKELRKVKVKLDADARVRREKEATLKQYKGGIATLEYQKRKLYEQYPTVKDITLQNNIVAKVNAIDIELKEANKVREDLENELNSLDAAEKTKFVNTVIDLGQKVDKAQEDYKTLADDPDVKEALEKMNQPGKPKMKLGPSAEFTAAVNQLKRWRSDVASDSIPIKHDNGVPTVEVTLNGDVIREMIVDSGASMVCLTADLAQQLKIVPTEKDPTISMQMADGKLVDCKKMSLKSIRVGQFTVTDVDCAVLPASLVAAEPLLGQTFLNNFTYKLDPKAGELHLAVIAGNSHVTTAAPSKDTKKTGKASEK